MTLALTDAELMAWLLLELHEIGVRESPAKPNDGPRIREYQAATGNAPPDAYCMSFQWWAMQQTLGNRIAAAGLRVSGSCEEVRRSARKLGWLHTSRPKQFDIGLLIDVKADHAHHAFQVIGDATEAWAFPTCEANTNPAGGREGYGVFARTRTDLPTGSQYEFIRLPRAA